MLRVICTVLAGLFIVACGQQAGAHHQGSAQVVGTTQPNSLLAAETSAQAVFDLMSGGGYGEAWDDWTPVAQEAVSRPDFIKISESCDGRPGVPYELTGHQFVDEGIVTVTWRREEQAGAATLYHQGGRWRFEPQADALAQLKQGRCDR